MPLPSPENFDGRLEAKRFGWILQDSSWNEWYKIHGGCGLSRRLLHLVSQITYCAARFHQYPETFTTPTTVEYLERYLKEMRQWNGESTTDWEAAKMNPPEIDMIRTLPEGYVISSSNAMINATAEAWRIAVIIYLQCRLLRLSRNDAQVLANMSDLAKCISIMPTSGDLFTAQAPLFPVFLLGMLATEPQHKETARKWFEAVAETPARNSVPVLYESLKRIWSWIDRELVMTDFMVVEPHTLIKDRRSWWEDVVARIYETEDQVLCLT
ncbi:hypothetical protein QQS21_011305 [Conoideocrella luteorostrata]|uniref:Uncharacterized protein n=1 Tax=Conoideocrella luteorostrata TaxID=1105319 RepID=A0AAJ0FNP3_9HYPO|nr:hypothetical protein QQS21_011305 [Conoideocrella luteorostrata]